ncbi:MAG: ABC transporter ATP-binding protein, partial [Clostridiales bacterium]|nr:ABC transporter ATP-binding protein [Clostridiales bacterium]
MQQFEEQDYTKRFSLSLWKKVLQHTKEYHGDLIRLMVTMGITAACDVVFPLLTSYAIDHFIPTAGRNGTMEGLPGFVAVYLTVLAVQVYAIYRFLYLGGKIEVGACYTIRKKAFRKLQELPFSYYDRMPVGYLMSRMTSDTQRLAETIGWSLLDLAWGGVMIVAASATMFVLNWKLTLVVLLVVPPLALISWWFQQRILHAYRKVRKTNSQITGAFNEGIMGAKTTKTLVREEMNMEEFTVLTKEMKSSSVRAASLSALYMPIVVSLGSIATAYALWQGGREVMIGGMTLGVFQVFFNYTVQFFEPIRNIANVFAEMQSAQAAAERVMTLLDTQPDIVDTPEVEKEFGDNFHPKKENWPA